MVLEIELSRGIFHRCVWSSLFDKLRKFNPNFDEVSEVHAINFNPRVL